MSGIDLTRGVENPNERKLTEEQQAILDHEPNSDVAVEAGAGTGKTSTLAAYARRWSDRRGLYLAFNKAIAEEAQGRFPSWVRAQTMHSYAHQALGVGRHRNRLTNRILRKTIRDLGVDAHSEYMSPTRFITAVHDGIVNFCADGGNDFLPRHCGLEKSAVGMQQAMLPRIATIVQRFVNYEESGLPFTHDIYLKYFEMHGSLAGFDYVMIDEAQDSNGVTMSIARKSGLPVLMIGDRRQAIYGFRGAVNAMEKLDCPRLPLSMSWRFGPQVADLANAILNESEQKQTLVIRGRPDRETRIERYDGKAPARSFLLSRTNGRLLDGLVSIPPKTTFHVAGGFDVLATQMLSALALSKNDQANVKDGYVRQFLHWEDLRDEADHDDPDARKLVKIVGDYGEAIPQIIERLRSQHRQHHQDAMLLLSTAHKAKGLEADCVIVLDDFTTPKELRARVADEKLSEADYEQELNLLYVSVTRARHRLLLNSALYDEYAHVIEGDAK